MSDFFKTTQLRVSEFERYSRQIMLDGWGEEGQLRLKNARVVIIGCGGLGNIVATYLVGAGVGTISLIDGDDVELSNLPRQIAFDRDSCGFNKADELTQRLFSQNDDVDIHVNPLFVDADNIDELLQHHDLVIDCSDNFETRRLINHWCVTNKLALLSASVIGWQGQALLVLPNLAYGCYQCLFDVIGTQKKSCQSMGVSPAMVGIIGSYQANEALRFLLKSSSKLSSHVSLIDGANFSVSQFLRVANPQCDVCARIREPNND